MAKSLSKIWNNKASGERRPGDSAASDTHYVFLIIGCFLTIAVSLGLNVFSDSFVRSEVNKLTAQTVEAYFQELEQDQLFAESLGNIIEFSGIDGVPALQERLARVEDSDKLNNFDRILLYYRENGGVVAKTLYQQSFAVSDLNVEANLHQFDEIFEHDGMDAPHGRVFLDFPLFMKRNAARHKPVVALVHGINIDSVGDALVVGVGNVDGIVSDDWIEHHPLVDFVDIRDVNTYSQLYKFQLKGGSFLEYRLHDLNTSETVFGGVKWEIKTRFRKEGIIFILESIPLFGAFFGAFLTIFAAIYAYVQQKQAHHMLRMNWALEDKNAELEHENEKREMLNQNLKKSEEENRAVIDSISDIIFETNTKGEIVYANAAWPRITGFNMVQSKGQDLFNLLHPNDQDVERERFALLVRGEQMAYRTFTRLRTRDGMFRAIELSFSVMRMSSKGDMHVVGAITDLEDRRRAERALGEAEKKYREIVENAAWGIYQVTPEGIYLSANSALVKVLGYQNAEEMLHVVKNAHEQVYGNARERKVFLREVDVRGAVNNHETQVFDRDGQVLWVSENIRAVKDDSGAVLYYEGSLEDITERKEATLMLSDAKIHSDMANRAKSEFLTNMSHELRTPLNAIIGFSEILKSGAFGPLGHESYKEYVDDIYESGRGLLGIINEILEISRIEVRERELNESIVELPEVIDSCLSLLGNKVHANQIEIMNLIEDIPPVIAEDRAMKQIFVNILSNAVKFTPRGGRVTLRHEMTGPGDMVISVTDTGVGLEPDQIKKALSAFGQVGSSLDQDNSGTGLGLTLVKSLVELHGGRLEIFSQKGMGTTVSVRLPAKRVQMASGEVHDAVPADKV